MSTVVPRHRIERRWTGHCAWTSLEELARGAHAALDSAFVVERTACVMAPSEEGSSSLMDPSAPRHIVLPVEAQSRRTLIVGDIHGCADEFRALLADHHRPGDTLILAGDLVNKGPKSEEVIPLARQLGAFAVVGNHELAVLRGRRARQRQLAEGKKSTGSRCRTRRMRLISAPIGFVLQFCAVLSAQSAEQVRVDGPNVRVGRGVCAVSPLHDFAATAQRCRCARGARAGRGAGAAEPPAHGDDEDAGSARGRWQLHAVRRQCAGGYGTT